MSHHQEGEHVCVPILRSGCRKTAESQQNHLKAEVPTHHLFLLVNQERQTLKVSGKGKGMAKLPSCAYNIQDLTNEQLDWIQLPWGRKGKALLPEDL